MLIIEHDEDIGSAITERLESWGCKTRLAQTGPEAISIAVTSYHDVVILDLNLVDMDGLLVLQCLREIDPTVLAVVLASEPDPWVQKQAIDIGIFGYLVKPYESHEFDTFVASAIKAKTLSRSKQCWG